MNYYTKKREKVKFSFSWKFFLTRTVLVLASMGLLSLIYFIPVYRAKVDPEVLQSQFITENNNIRQSFKLMQNKHFDFSAPKKSSFSKKFAGFFKLESLCDDYIDACLWNNLTYRTLDGEILPIYFGTPNIGQFRVRSGALYMLYTFDNDLWIFIDVNGINSRPNRFGLDLFAFYIAENTNELKIMGGKGTPYQNMNLYCNPYTSNKYNGLSCSYKAIFDRDYFTDTVKVLY